MSSFKKYLLVFLSFLLTLAIGAVTGILWTKRKVVPPKPATKVPPPPDFVQSLQDKKEEIDAEVQQLDRDALADDINSRYD